MSRWKSPQAAAQRAQRAQQQAKELRKEKWTSWLLVIGVALGSVGLTVADYFWLRARARQRRDEHVQTHHRTAMETNVMVAPGPATTNHPTNE